MFFTPVLILNMQRLVATSENSASTSTKEINKAYEARDKMLFAMNDQYSKVNYERNELEKIRKIAFDSLMESVTFPKKMQSSWPSKCGDEKYEIKKKDMGALQRYSDENVHNGKNEALHLALLILYEKTRQLHSDILIRNFTYDHLNYEQLINILKMSVNIKLNDQNNLIFEQVQKNNDHKEIMKSIDQANICNNVIKNMKDLTFLKDGRHLKMYLFGKKYCKIFLAFVHDGAKLERMYMRVDAEQKMLKLNKKTRTPRLWVKLIYVFDLYLICNCCTENLPEKSHIFKPVLIKLVMNIKI
ncbi:uncharacterized protein VNE69_01082 [Vairimorpha necatrix]|uniref:Uncharacterized protein n=1 Tax=Vairimorpha necatrix TaxID=6039 RepID=A0AAX4J8A3_9MICR